MEIYFLIENEGKLYTLWRIKMSQAHSHSLTAYRCIFSYLEYNNPIDTDEMKEKIKNGEKPNYSLTSFMHDYISVASSPIIAKSADKVIQLTQIASSTSLPDNVTRIHIQPQVGKYGEPVTVVERDKNRINKFGKNDPALYDYNVFFYEQNNDIIVIFYRKGTSGCKTAFIETANVTLRAKGMKLEMSLILH